MQSEIPPVNPAARYSEVLAKNQLCSHRCQRATPIAQTHRGLPGKASHTTGVEIDGDDFVRTTELIDAKWTEFDLEGGRWDVPAERMKMRTPHIVPLSRQAKEVLDMLQELAGSSEWLFPGER